MHISALPIEMLEKILENLSVEQKFRVSEVSQRWLGAALRSITYLTDSRLKTAKKSYEKCFNQQVDIWSIFHLFPKCRILDIVFDFGPNQSPALDAIGTHLCQMEEFVLTMYEPPVGYDFKQLGTRLCKLVSFDLKCWSKTPCNYCDMTRFCSNLTKIKLFGAVITDDWNKAMPKRVTSASIIYCEDRRSERNEGLFSFLCQDVQSLAYLNWAARDDRASSRDLVGLDNLKRLQLAVNMSVHAAAFEHCKAVEFLTVKVLRLKDLTAERHILSKLESIDIKSLNGRKQILKLFCPNVVNMYLGPGSTQRAYRW